MNTIRNRDQIDDQLKLLIVNTPGISFTQLKKLVDVNASTLGYRLITLELAGEITCKKRRNQNQYFPNPNPDPNNKRV